MSSNKVTIKFGGKSITCRPDTSLAVALWENGVRHLSHSHKYGKPRGVNCARGHCTSCLMRVDGIPNVRTCHTPVQEGMVVEIQDAGAFYGPPMQKILSIGGHLFPVGFYYKWFTKPAVLSRFFLDQIRPLTGVGRLPDPSAAVADLPAASAEQPAEIIPSANLGNLGTLIIGAGPSGLAAALAANGPVTIIDDHLQPGGQRASALGTLAQSTTTKIERFGILASAHKRLKTLHEDLKDRSDIHFHLGMRAIAGYRPNGLVLRDEHNLFTSTFTNLIWAAGALDTLGLFPGNDTPGVIGPRAAYRLLQRDGLKVEGKRVLVLGCGFDLWLSAALLAARGASISLVVTEPGNNSEVSAAVDLGWQLTTGLQLSEIREQGLGLVEATFVPRASTPGPAHSHMRLKADFAVICGRGKPAYDIPYQLGADLTAQTELGGYAPRGAKNGSFSGQLPNGHGIQVLGEAAGALPGYPAASNEKKVSS